jgi:hypothetical protein
MNDLTPIQTLVETSQASYASKEKRLKRLYNERALVINHLASIDRLIAEVQAETTKETCA